MSSYSQPFETQIRISARDCGDPCLSGLPAGAQKFIFHRMLPRLNGSAVVVLKGVPRAAVRQERAFDD
jgi:hypothetical protein